MSGPIDGVSGHNMLQQISQTPLLPATSTGVTVSSPGMTPVDPMSPGPQVPVTPTQTPVLDPKVELQANCDDFAATVAKLIREGKVDEAHAEWDAGNQAFATTGSLDDQLDAIKSALADARNKALGDAAADAVNVALAEMATASPAAALQKLAEGEKAYAELERSLGSHFSDADRQLCATVKTVFAAARERIEFQTSVPMQLASLRERDLEARYETGFDLLAKMHALGSDFFPDSHIESLTKQCEALQTAYLKMTSAPYDKVILATNQGLPGLRNQIASSANTQGAMKIVDSAARHLNDMYMNLVAETLDVQKSLDELAAMPDDVRPEGKAHLLQARADQLRGLEGAFAKTTIEVAAAHRQATIHHQGNVELVGYGSMTDVLASIGRSTAAHARRDELKAELAAGTEPGRLAPENRAHLYEVISGALSPMEAEMFADALTALATPDAPITRETAASLSAAMGHFLDPAAADKLRVELDAVSAKARDDVMARLNDAMDSVFRAGADKSAIVGVGTKLNSILEMSGTLLTDAHQREITDAIGARVPELSVKLYARASDLGLISPALRELIESPPNGKYVDGKPSREDVAEMRNGYNGLLLRCWGDPQVLLQVQTLATSDSAKCQEVLGALARGGEAAMKAVDTLLMSDPNCDDIALNIKNQYNLGVDGEPIIPGVAEDHAASRTMRDLEPFVREQTGVLPQGAEFNAKFVEDLALKVAADMDNNKWADFNLLVLRADYQNRLAATPDAFGFKDYRIALLPSMNRQVLEPHFEAMIMGKAQSTTAFVTLGEQAGRIGGKIGDNQLAMRSAKQMSMTNDAWAVDNISRTLLWNLGSSLNNYGKSADDLFAELQTRMDDASRKARKVGPLNWNSTVAVNLAASYTDRTWAASAIAKNLGKIAGRLDGLAVMQQQLRAFELVEATTAAPRHLRVLREINGHLPSGQRFMDADGGIKPRKMHSATLAAGVRVLTEAIGLEATAANLAECKDFVAGITFQQHIDFASFRSVDRRGFFGRAIPREGDVEKEFRAYLSDLSNAPDAEAFNKAREKMQFFLASHRLDEKADAVLYIDAIQEGQQGRGMAMRFASVCGKAFGELAVDAIRSLASAHNVSKAELDTFQGRKTLLANSFKQRLAVSKELKKIQGELGKNSRNAMNDLTRIVVLRQFGKTSGITFAQMVNGARNVSDVNRKGCIEGLKSLLDCDDDLAEFFLDRQLEILGPNANLNAINARTRPSFFRRCIEFQKGLTNTSPSTMSAFDQKAIIAGIIHELKPGVEIGLNTEAGVSASLAAGSPFVVASASLGVTKSCGLVLSRDADGSVTLDLKGGYSAGLDLVISDVGKALSVGGKLEGGRGKGVRVTFSNDGPPGANARLESFLQGMLGKEDAAVMVRYASNIAGITYHNIGGEFNASLTPLNLADSTLAYAKPDVASLSSAEQKAVGVSSKISWLPLQLDVTFVVGGDKEETTITDPVSGTTTRESESHFNLDFGVNVGTSLDPVRKKLIGVNPYYNENYVVASADNAVIVPFVRMVETEAVTASAKAGKPIRGRILPVHIESTRNQQEIVRNGRTIEATVSDLMRIDPSRVAPEAASIVLEKAGVTNGALKAQLATLLGQGRMVTLSVQSRLKADILQEYAMKNMPVPASVLNAKESYEVSGYTLSYDEATARHNVNLGINIPLSKIVPPIGNVVQLASTGVKFTRIAEGSRRVSLSYNP